MKFVMDCIRDFSPFSGYVSMEYKVMFSFNYTIQMSNTIFDKSAVKLF